MSTFILAAIVFFTALSVAALIRAYRSAPEGREDEEGFTASRKATYSARVEVPARHLTKHSSHHRVA